MPPRRCAIIGAKSLRLTMQLFKRKQNRLAQLFIVAGAIALLFSFLISFEKMQLIADPNYVPPCDVSPFISCGSVMQTPQAAVFGFPNSWIGIAGFSIVVTIGFALLAGATFKRWFWKGIEVGLFLATVFIYWLFFQSVYRIGALCPYCMGVWATTIPLFWYTTTYNLREGHISLPKSLDKLLLKNSTLILILMYAVIVVAILVQFWSYWQTLI